MKAEGKPWRSQRWPRRVLLLGLVVLSVYLFRGFLLYSVGSFLVVEEEVKPAEYALLLDEAVPPEAATRLYQSGLAQRVLLVESHPRRLVEMDILPSRETLVRRWLAAQRMPVDCLVVLYDDGDNDWGRVRRLRDFLDERSEVQVTALCQRFASRRWRFLFDSLLSRSAATRVHLHPLRHRFYDETNWWQQKQGILSLFNSYVGYGYVKVAGEDEEWHRWDPERYEKALR
jgi:hypothetical protein